jgi:C4-dicarboxylate-specific signal transduction histidine kinase
MIAIDIHTALLFNALLYLVMPIVTWFVLAKLRTDQVRLWCLGGLVLGFALFLISLQGRVSDWIAPTLSTAAVTVSTLLRIQSLRMDLGIQWRARVIALISLVSMLIFEVLHRQMEANVLRAQFASTVQAWLLLHLAHLAWRIGRRELSYSARWIAGAYTLVGLAQVFRVLFLSISPPANPSLVQENLVTFITSISLIISAVISHMAFIGMALDRSRQRELKLVEERGREAERRKLAEQIAHLDRQRGLGELSASLGHELNQPLATILTNAQTAKRGMETGYLQPPQVIELLDKVAQSTRRASQIIDRIRGYIRPSATRDDPVDLNTVLSESLALIADEARRQKVSIRCAPAAGPLLVRGDAIQLSQIIVNVLRNAVDAMLNSERRELSLACVGDGERAIMQVRDTGPGLAAETLAQVGAPFFTTKSSGLGMGIAISRSIAAHHGGTLKLQNVPAAEGSGVVAELSLPAMGSPRK